MYWINLALVVKYIYFVWALAPRSTVGVMHYFIQTIKFKKANHCRCVYYFVICNARPLHTSLKRTAAAISFQFGLCNNVLASLLPSQFTIVIRHATQVFFQAVHAVFHWPSGARMRADYWVLHKCFMCASKSTSGAAMAEGPREALGSRNPATTKHLTWKPYHVALFAWFYV